jgi:methylmalonyl-CoA mutase
MKQTLDFNEFSNSTIDIWKKGVTKELGDKPYDSLIWSFDDNLNIEPYYSSNIQTLDVVAKTTREWSIKESFIYADALALNKAILLSLEGGINAIEIILEQDAEPNFELLFKGVFVQYIQVYFNGPFANSSAIRKYFSYCESIGVNINSLSGGLLSAAAQDELEDRIKLISSHPSALHFFSIDAFSVQNKGGHASHSIVYALNEGTRLLETLVNKGLSASMAANSIRFVFASEPSYFIEIGKLRAFRTLWAQVLKAFDVNKESINSIQIDTKTSGFYQSSVDRHNNMLRATTQSMSSIIGGTDTLEVIGFEQSLNQTTNESRRWARNIQHLLIEESYFNQLQDAAKGSYYIEEITFKLAAHAWQRFQYWQAKNEALNYSKEWNEHLEYCLTEMKKAIENGSKVFLGVNKYPNKSEKVSSEKTRHDRLVADFESKIGEGGK